MSTINSVRWYFNCKKWLPSKDEFLMAMSCIQEDEREKAMKFVYKKDVKSKVIGRLMLRRCISAMLGLSDDEISLRRSDKERPELAPDCYSKYKQNSLVDRPFDFNLSHDGDYCVVAGDWAEKVGIDLSRVRLERDKPIQRYFETMARIFSDQEWSYIQGDRDEQLRDEDRLFRFHRVWALKESLVKADGSGITTDLRRFTFYCPTRNLRPESIISDTSVSIDGKEARKWIFEETLLDDQHIVSVALFNDAISNMRPYPLSKAYPIVKSFKDLITVKDTYDVDESYWTAYLRKEEGKS